MAMQVKRIEYHQVHSHMTYDIDDDSIIEEFGSLDRFKTIIYAVEGVEPDEDEDEVTDEEMDKAMDFISEHDYDREDDWFTDRKGGYDVEYEIVED